MQDSNRKDLLDKCARELAMNFECPAPQIMGVYASRLGVSVKQLERLLMARDEPGAVAHAGGYSPSDDYRK